MRILQVTPYGPETLGGVPVVSFQLAQSLGERDVHVQWMAGGTIQRQLKNVTFTSMRPLFRWRGHELFAHDVWSISSIKTLLSSIRTSDIVQFHDILHVGCLAAFCWATLLGVPTVFTEHLGIMQQPTFYKPLHLLACIARWFILRNATAVVYVARHLQEQDVNIVARSSEVIVSGIDPTVFHLDDLQPDAWKKSLGWNPTRPTLLFTGRFENQKRLSLIRTLATRHSEWQWVLVGKGSIDPRSWQLPNMLVLPPSDHKTLARYYHAADLFVLPTFGEGISLSMLEALACGLPVVISSIVQPEQHLPAYAFVSVADENSDEKSAEAWSTSLQETLQSRNWTERRSQLRSHPIDRTWEKMSDEYYSLYQSILQNHGHPTRGLPSHT